MKTITVRANEVSQPYYAGAGSRITLTGSGRVEWAAVEKLQDALNGATWNTWPAGSTAGYRDTERGLAVRVVGTGACTVTIEEGKGDPANEGAYWQPVGDGVSAIANPLTGVIEKSAGGKRMYIGTRRFHSVVMLSNYCALDGVTDDTAGFAAAMAAVPAGGALYLGEAGQVALVRVSATDPTAAIDLDGFDGRGMFGGATIRQASNVPAGISIMRGVCHNSYFAGFTLDGNVTARNPGAYGPEGEGFNPKNSTGLTVEYVTVVSCHQDAFDFDDCSDCYLYRCVAQDCWGDGYHMGGSVVGVYNTNTVIDTCVSVGCGQERRASGDPYGEGFSIAGTRNKIINCTSINDQRGIRCESANSVVCGNIIVDCGADGATGDVAILIDTSSLATVVSGNIVPSTSSKAGSVGIKVTGIRNVISNNSVKNNKTGIEVGGSFNTVEGNQTNTSDTGILISGAANWSFVRNNTLETSWYGVRADSSKARIAGNSIVTATEQGIDLRAGSCVVSGNEVINGSKFGVRMFNASVTGCTVFNNVIDATSGGVSLAGTGHLVSNNVVNGAYVP